mgnify:CR=1 FL=1
MDTYKNKESKLNLYGQRKDGRFFTGVIHGAGGHVPTLGLVPVILCNII